MCRIAGYLGEPLPLSALLATPPHSLRAQAKLPRELPPGVLGSDGFGVGWFAAGRSSPARYRSLLPIWVDENVDGMADHVSSSSFIASSRTASRRMPVAITNTPPFVAGASLLVHNGEIERFQDRALDAMRSQLSEQARVGILGNTDTEYLAAALSDQREARLADRVRAAFGVVRRCAEAARTTAQLNLIVTMEAELVAVRYAIGADAPSLYVKRSASGLLVASEPMNDEPGWRSLQAGDLVCSRRASNGQDVEWARVEER